MLHRLGGKGAISTHALREEGDEDRDGDNWRELIFLPTPSARRATDGKAVFVRFHPISTHALREEGDRQMIGFTKTLSNFYPRPPRGGRPRYMSGYNYDRRISTHALREEGDNVLPTAFSKT